MNHSNIETTPALSALVVIPDTFETVARTLHALQQQSCRERLEIVMVVPSAPYAKIPLRALNDFDSYQIIELPNLTYASAMAEAVRRARAPLVVMTEDHAFPAPNWAERLIAAHQKPFAAVGPMVRNANPTGLISWADFFIAYGKWAEPLASGRQDFLMGHNSSYKRAALLEYGAELEKMLQAETVLFYDLAARGAEFWLEATTYVAHLNFEKPRAWLRATWYQARVFAAQRATRMSRTRRLLYAFAAPLIPFVRFRRVRRDIVRTKFSAHPRVGLYALVLANLFVDAAAQALGYLFGRGSAHSADMDHEFHRERYIKFHPTGE